MTISPALGVVVSSGIFCAFPSGKICASAPWPDARLPGPWRVVFHREVAPVLKPMDYKLIHTLHQAGLTDTAIAAQVGCHRNSVRNILRGRLPDQAEVVADRMRPACKPGPASKVACIREQIAAALKADARLPGGALLTRARQEWGYTNGA